MGPTVQDDALGALVDALGEADPETSGVLATLAMAKVFVLLGRPPGRGQTGPKRTSSNGTMRRKTLLSCLCLHLPTVFRGRFRRR